MKKWDFTDGKQNILDAYHEELNAGSYDEIKRKYRDPATVYAFQVLDENVLTSRTIKLDAFRHLQDLRRQTEDPNFKYTYDLDRARLIVQFASLCPEPKSNRPIPLDLWQLAILCKIVAWRDKKRPEFPRFSDVIVSIARTNGKTYMSTILMAYYYIVDVNSKYNQDLGYVATTATQVKKGWRYITSTFNMLRNQPGFKRIFKNRLIKNDKEKVEDNRQNSLMALTEASQIFDAFHFNLCVMDEAGSDDFNVQSIAENKDTIVSGMTQTRGQVVQISTAYPDSNSYLYGDEKMNISAMEQDYDRALDDHLCMIWQQDSLDEVKQPDTWIKSNPLMAHSQEKFETMKTTLLSHRDGAMKKGKLNEFENKNLNRWLESRVNSYLELKSIEQSIVKKPPINIDDHEVYVGLDISHASDDTAVAFVFPYKDPDDGETKFYIKQHSFVPLAHVQGNLQIKSGMDGVDYAAAERLGYCDVMRRGRGYISDTAVYNYVKNYIDKHNLDLKMFCYDPWDRSNMVRFIVEKSGWTLLEVRQQPSQLDAPTHFLREQMDEGNIKIDDDPILQWSAKNAILKETTAGIKIDKDAHTQKIDCMDAIMDAMFIAMGSANDLTGGLKQRKDDPFAFMSKQEQNDYLNELINLNF